MRMDWPANRKLDELIAALNDDQIVTERCATCSSWEHEGSFKEGRAAFRAHVEQVHPELVRALNAKRMTMSFVPKREPEFALLRRLAELAAA